MAKIYTRTGDRGETGLIGGVRVAKDHARVAAYGDVDELNAALGLARALLAAERRTAAPARQLGRIQSELFELGAELAAPSGVGRIGAADAAALERAIDRLSADLPALHRFILPGGSPAGAALHLARTVCRRAERSLAALRRSEAVRAEALVYLNRLSDYLFTLARFVNQKLRQPETPWSPRKQQG